MASLVIVRIFETAAKREAIEEVGARISRLEKMNDRILFDEERQQKYRVVMFRAEIEADCIPEIREPDVFSEIGWFSLDQIKKLTDLTSYSHEDFIAAGLFGEEA